MNPVPAALLLAFAIGSGFAPWRKAGWTTPVRSLLCEAGALIAAIVLAWLSRGLVYATPAGYFWGKILLLAAGYWYACAGGASLVRRVLDLVPVSEAPKGGKEAISIPAVELSRGLVIGVLERTLALTLVLTNQFSALGLVLAAKAIVRYQALDDRDFAEYVLIGTLTSLLIALFVGLGLRVILS